MFTNTKHIFVIRISFPRKRKSRRLTRLINIHLPHTFYNIKNIVCQAFYLLIFKNFYTLSLFNEIFNLCSVSKTLIVLS